MTSFSKSFAFRHAPLCWAFVVLLLSRPCHVLADEPVPAVSYSRQLNVAAAPDWQSSGTVRWTDSGAELSENSAILRKLTASDSVWCAIQLSDIGVVQAERETWVELVYEDGGRDRMAVMRQGSLKGLVCRVELVTERPSGGNVPLRREMLDRVFDSDWSSGRWELRWEHGVLTLVHGKQSLAKCLPNVNFFGCKEIRIAQPRGQAVVSDVEIRSSPLLISGVRQAERQQAATQLTEMRREFERGNSVKAFQASAVALNYATRYLGAEHGSTASIRRNQAIFKDDASSVSEILPLYEKLVGRDSEHYASLLILRGEKGITEKESLESFNSGLQILRRLLRPEDRRLADYLKNVGWNLYQRNLPYQAEPILKEAAELHARSLGQEHPNRVGSLNALALVLQRQGRLHDAKATFEEALAIFQKTDDPQFLPDRSVVLTNLGFLLANDFRRDLDQAEGFLRAALDIRRTRFGMKSAPYFRTLNCLGVCYYELRRDDEAEAVYREALTIANELFGPDSQDSANIYTNLARLHLRKGALTTAHAMARRASALQNIGAKLNRQGTNDPNRLRGISQDMVKTLHLSTEIAVAMGDVLMVAAGAQVITQHAAAVHGKDHPEYASELAQAVNYLVNAGHPDLGLMMIQEDAALLEKIYEGESRQAADVSFILAILHRERGDDLSIALKRIEHSLKIREREFGRESDKYVRALNQLGNLRMKVGSLAEALVTFREALALSEKIDGPDSDDSVAIAGNLAHAESLNGHSQEALSLSSRILEVRWKQMQTKATVASGDSQLLTLTRDYRESLNRFLEAAVAAGHSVDDSYFHVVRGKGLAFLRQRDRQMLHDQPELTEHFAELQSVSRKLAVFESQGIKSYGSMELFVKLQVTKFALEQELLSKRRSLRAAQAVQETLVEDLRSAIPANSALVDFHSFPSSKLVVDPESNKTVLKTDWRLVAFVLRQGQSTKLVELGAAQPVADAMQSWRQAIVENGGESPRGFVSSATANKTDAVPQMELRRMIWQPIESHLRGVTLVLISPDAVLSNCPFGALPGAEPGTYLIEQCSLALCPVPQLLLEIKSSSATDANAQLLLVGGVDFGADPGHISTPATEPLLAQRGGDRVKRPQFSPLSGTVAEVDQLSRLHASIMQSAERTLLRGAAATEEALQRAMPRAQFIHLATHGFFTEDQDLLSAVNLANEGDKLGEVFRWAVRSYNPDVLSGLVLAGANQPAANAPDQELRDDGILTAAEVAACDLRQARLVVLSACETGLGKHSVGEGLLGLQRAFQIAGASSVVASLWSVPDQPTQVLMDRFYTNLWQKRMTKLEALREAQLWMLREGKAQLDLNGKQKPQAESSDRLPPYFWAAFTLSGDWR